MSKNKRILYIQVNLLNFLIIITYLNKEVYFITIKCAIEASKLTLIHGPLRTSITIMIYGKCLSQNDLITTNINQSMTTVKES